MKSLSTIIITTILFLFAHISAATQRFGETLCHNAEYSCLKVMEGDTWDSLYPDLREQDIVKRVNRMNISLKEGIILAAPKNLENLTIYDVSPFPRYIEPTGEKEIFVSQKQLAWGAYDEQGELVWWGPISSGSGNCPSIDGHCLTPTGSFRIIRKQDIDCISTVFPVRANGMSGGAEMPFCMHFLTGTALHGSDTLPGYRASHGCVRMFIEDARWLNEDFIDLPGAGGLQGTRVTVDGI